MTDSVAILVTSSDIADLAGVGRSAVANWRRRHADFPVATDNRFDLAEVERWLIINGKIDGPISPDRTFWWLVDALDRSLESPHALAVVAACLVYVEMLGRSAPPGCDGAVEAAASAGPIPWSEVRKAADEDLWQTLFAAVSHMVGTDDHDDGLVLLHMVGFARSGSADASALRALIDLLTASASGSSHLPPRFELFDDLLERENRRDVFRGECSTPRPAAELMASLGHWPSEVLDLAAGQGGLLMEVRNEHLHHAPAGVPQPRFRGYERAGDLVNLTKARFYLYGEDVTVFQADSLVELHDEPATANLVVVDPPMGTADWADADVLLSDRWGFGTPPVRNADFAWIQVAIEMLAPDGTALVLTVASALSRAGTEAAIRSRLLDAGCVRGVIALPPRMRLETTVPQALWLLGRPDPTRTSVVLVDAVEVGTSARSGHALTRFDIELISAAFARGQSEPGDQVFATTLAVSALGAHVDLTPARYRPTTTLDRTAAEARRNQLHDDLDRASAALTDAVAALLGRGGRS